jgi:uncharacterized protein
MSATNKKICFTSDAKFSIRPSADGGPGVLTGYALVWNQKSTDRGGFKVLLAPNSAQFESATFALWNHDYNAPLARTDAGSLTLTNDDYGVKADITLPNTSTGRDVAELVRTGIVKGMSFGMLLDGAKFTTAKDSVGDEVDTFTSYGVDEVTITPIPAFVGTSIEVASSADATPSPATSLSETKETTPFVDHSWGDLIILENKRLDTYAIPLAEF